MADFSNSFMQAADIEQIKATGESMRDSYTDYLLYGTASAITSAAVSFYNTGVALGEAVGFDLEDSRVNSINAVNSVFGEEAADFYTRHKEGVDLVGFIAGSLIPGGAAISALRVAQRAGKLTEGMKLATGMKDADLVLGSPAMARATEAVLSRSQYNLSNPAVWRAYSRGLQQQVLEAGVAEIAVIATMNQNPTVNSEGLGYFEAVKSQALASTPYVLGGGVLGGALEVYRVRGALKRSWDAEATRTADLANPDVPEVFGMSPGDKVVLYSRTLEDFRLSPQFAVEEGDEFAKRQKAVGEGIINRKIEEAITEVNATGSAEVVPTLQRLLKGDESGSIDFAKLDSLLSGLGAIRNFSLKEGEDLFQYYAKTEATKVAAFVPNEQGFDDLASHVWSTFRDKLGVRYSQNFEEFKQAYKSEWLETLERTHGVATAGVNQYGTPVMNLVYDSTGGGILFPAAYTNSKVVLRENGVPARQYALEFNNLFRRGLNKTVGTNYKDLTLEQFDELVMLHELTHAKANTPQHLTEFWERAGKKGHKFVEELVTLSKANRDATWNSFEDIAKFAQKQWGTNFSETMLRLAKGEKPPNYWTQENWLGNFEAAHNAIFSPRELLADAGAQLTHPATREAAAKLAPSVAKYFDQMGGLAKSFTPKKLYYNQRTGETLTSYLPGVNDFGKMTYGKGSMTSHGLKRSFTRNLDGFKQLFDSGDLEETFKITKDYLDFSAQWAMGQQADLATLVDDAGNLAVKAWDLPMLEKVLTDAEFTGKVKITGLDELDGVTSREFLDKDELAEYVVQRKTEMRGKLLSDPQNRFNEHEVSHILNIDIDSAMGFPTDKSKMLLMAERDFTKAEVLGMYYTSKLPADYKYSAHSMQAVQERLTVQRDLEQRSSATLLGEAFNKLPGVDKINAAAAGQITGSESRSGFITQARSDFGSVREMASYIGNIVRQAKAKKNQEVVDDFAKAYRTFNAPDAGALRAELSFASNLMSRDWYKLARGVDAEGNAVTYMIKKQLADDAEFWGLKSADELPDLMDLNAQGLNIVDSARMQGQHGAVKVSEAVADFLEMHKRRNADLVRNKKVIAETKGLHFTADPDVLYAPPRDLKKTKFFSFVIPTDFTSGADPRKYMVYGTTAEELALKSQKISEMYGGSYKIVTNQDAIAYKKLQKEYDSGLVFDEVHFDQGAFRSGTSAELAPNLELEGSYTLERFRNFHHRQEEYIINSGVELKYSEFVNRLKDIDRERSKFQKSTLFAKEQQSSIWEDTSRLLLDDKGTGGELEQLWNRVNDFIGERGSQVLGDAIDILRKAARPGQRLTQEKLDEYNAYLADKGYNPPFQKVSEALIASPNLQDSRLVPSLVKTMNNLTSTLMLRLDMAHNMINVMSAPILLSPVLKEAKEYMSGPGRQALDDLTTVVHPDTGLKEPTVMKLMTNATKAFFSKEGKQFLQELRDRGIVADYLEEYLDATDFSMLNGRHTLHTVNGKIEQLARFGGKYTGFTLAEEFTRFVTAHSIKQIADVRGIPADEMFVLAGSAVDKVHGIYRNTQRAQLFNGPVGQAIGLYQTYFFNFVQNAAKWAGDPDRKKLALQAALQGSIFGLQSFPGFQTLNHQIGMANADDDFKDIYSTLGATDEGSLGQYLLYGLGSHALVTPIDFYSRGDMAIRNALIVPTSPQDFPAVSIISKAIGNMINVGKQVSEGAPTGEALLHGLAHNGMNRPLQGLANIALGYTSNGRGQKYFDNVNYLDYNAANDMNFGAMFSRLIGSKPFNESVYMQAYFRSKEYQASMNDSLQKISTSIQLTRNAGERENYRDFALRYEDLGGDPENFKAYFSRQLTKASEPEVMKFKQELQSDSSLGRTSRRLNSEYSTKPIWEY